MKWFKESLTPILFLLVLFSALVFAVLKICDRQLMRRWIEIRRADGTSVGRYPTVGGVQENRGDLTWTDDDGVEHRFILGSCSVSFESREVEKEK